VHNLLTGTLLLFLFTKNVQKIKKKCYEQGEEGNKGKVNGKVALPLLRYLDPSPLILLLHETSCARGDTKCLRPLQVDNIFAFIRQVAPVAGCWLFMTSATS